MGSLCPVAQVGLVSLCHWGWGRFDDGKIEFEAFQKLWPLSRLCAALSLALALPDGAFGQEALRHSIAGEKMAAARKKSLEGAPHNLRLGLATARLDSTLEIEWNDNVNFANSERQADLIFRPQMGIEAQWPVTEANRLTLSLQLGYTKYLDHAEHDHLLVRPGSALSFDVFVGDWRFNLHEQLSYVQDPGLQGAVSNVAEFGGLSNLAGARGDWHLKDLIVTLGFDHHTFISSNSRFSYLDRNSELFLGRITAQLKPEFSSGLEATASLTGYDQHLLNDNLSYSVGGFADWQLSPLLGIKPRVGLTSYSFDLPAGAAFDPGTTSYYLDLQLEHAVNEYVAYTLTAGRAVDLGINSNLLELWYVRHSAAWRLVHRLDATTQIFYENGREPGAFGKFTFERIGLGLGLSCQLFLKMTARLTYRYLIKSTQIAFQDYAQNSVLLGLTYRF
ncbi:MAG: hypothetical protein L0Z50_28185 [Verrucomicrobiales bacterium]|nr:hypothetical protein [Verrucomicrobiales bacterium]